jgi:hypothetical protein
VNSRRYGSIVVIGFPDYIRTFSCFFLLGTLVTNMSTMHQIFPLSFLHNFLLYEGHAATRYWTSV